MAIRITLKPSRRLIQAGVAYAMHHDYFPAKITLRGIKKVVAIYIEQYGKSCLDNHETELSFWDEAETIITKYKSIPED